MNKISLIDRSPLLCGLYIWLRMKLGLTPPGFKRWLAERIRESLREDKPVPRR